ncbi:hypothetical protein ACO0K9_01470 [Undibacterium sp. Ji50W]|uniref:HD domain-containing protein n=1 Tax=Undibacterium sp. Ji50W TaxID=3413041 RepID=UPI003BEFDF03
MFLISNEQKKQLRQQWLDLIQGLAGSPHQAAKAWTVLDKHYSEPHRSYHNLSHVWALLLHADQMKADIRDFAVVALAIWFHDIIYDTHASNNELKSAELAGEILSRLEIDVLVIPKVQQCILATARHEVPQFKNQAHDLPLFLDIDLAILGAASDIYQQYSQAIRHEYRWVTAPSYRIGRVKVLKRFAEREQLFFTANMASRFDAQARANLLWEIKKLTFF